MSEEYPTGPCGPTSSGGRYRSSYAAGFPAMVCIDCGSSVEDREQHDVFHARIDRISEMASEGDYAASMMRPR